MRTDGMARIWAGGMGTALGTGHEIARKFCDSFQMCFCRTTIEMNFTGAGGLEGCRGLVAPTQFGPEACGESVFDVEPAKISCGDIPDVN